MMIVDCSKNNAPTISGNHDAQFLRVVYRRAYVVSNLGIDVPSSPTPSTSVVSNMMTNIANTKRHIDSTCTSSIYDDPRGGTKFRHVAESREN